MKVSISLSAAPSKLTLKEILDERAKLNARLVELNKLAAAFEKKNVSQDLKVAINYISAAGFTSKRSDTYSNLIEGEAIKIDIPAVPKGSSLSAVTLCRVKTASGQISWVIRVHNKTPQLTKTIPVRLSEPSVKAGIEKALKIVQRFNKDGEAHAARRSSK